MPNRLIEETSPYLLQHADNPVDWYPWGEMALQKAKRENKPILLSIGYAACHWCHVMAHESFVDQKIADLMNEWFINIKVDREERPDLDKIYQIAHQLLTGRSGGWPLTVFLTPDTHMPFYAGTYFPVEASFGRPGFKDLLIEVAHFYHQRRDVISQMTQTLSQALEKINQTSYQEIVLTETPLSAARIELEQSFDFVHGGFGHAPKFPLPTHLEFLLQTAISTSDSDALQMVYHSLTRMAEGGLCDQLGGGFFRYCVDADWTIPHFEKMLYDNAQLIPLYVNTARVKDDVFLQSCALAALQWVLRDMRSPAGGFYATMSADSEGTEGKFYVWDRQEIRDLLNSIEYSALAPYFGLNKLPNFEGHWHLHIVERGDKVIAGTITHAQEKLFIVREKRIHPAIDTKILTSWNALMVKALIISALRLDRADFGEIAMQTLDFIFTHLWQEGRLLAVYKDRQARFPAYLDDYAFLLEAVLLFLQWRWRDDYLQIAIALAEVMLQYFYDAENGGFYYTANDQESLVQRLKLFSDEAIPAGNGIAAWCLLLLGNLLGDSHYLSAAEHTLQAAWPQLSKRPGIHDSLLRALRAYFHGQTIIILRGEPSLIAKWQKAFSQYYIPDHLCYAIPSDSSGMPESLQKPAPATGVYAYICRGQSCQETIQSYEDFLAYITNLLNLSLT